MKRPPCTPHGVEAGFCPSCDGLLAVKRNKQIREIRTLRDDVDRYEIDADVRRLVTLLTDYVLGDR